MPIRLLKIVLLVAGIAAVVGAVYLVRSSDPAQVQIARINGQPLYESDLPAEVIGEIHSLRMQEYQVKYRAIRETALQRLLDAEAKRRNLSVEDLIKAEADAKVPDPTDADLKAYYDAQKDRLGKSLEEATSVIRETLRKPKVDAARQQYFLGLLEEADVQILVDAPRVEVAGDPARRRGNPYARVQIVEFSDFQCPYCRRAQPVLAAVLAKYGDKVNHSFRDFPLRDIHPRAQQAAEAARCAADQGKFWEYHKLLYDNFGQLSRDNLTAHAQSLQLDAVAFTACLDGQKYAEEVENDFQLGLRSGVSSTPNFFVNGIAVVGAQPQSAFERVIDAELARRRQ
jgi:protein-disulfide isomerase